MSQFELRNNLVMPLPVAWFLRNVTNGGTPVEDVVLTSYGQRENIRFHVQGLLGVDHPKEYFDLEDELKSGADFRPPLGFPIGYDGPNGKIFYIMIGRSQRQVHYMPWDEYIDLACSETYYVAKDMREFALLIEKAS